MKRGAVMPEEISLSIVVPVFNVENYLAKCLNSLLKTVGIEDTEIILIDDGSTDRSPEIADKYSREYSNIRVIHKDNEGPSAARNLGIREAKGTYISFIDSDDEVVPALYEKVIELASHSDADMFLWDAELIVENGQSMATKNEGYFSHYGLEKTEKTYSGKQIIETLLRNSGDFVATVWLGAYRKEFLVNNGLLFEQGLIHEDEFWVPKAMISAKTVHYIPHKIYRYRQRKGSIMNPNSKDRSEHVASLMKIYPTLYGYYEEVLAGEPLLELVEANLTKRYLHMIFRFNIVKYGYGKQIDKKLLWRKSRRIQDKLMVMCLYVYAH